MNGHENLIPTTQRSKAEARELGAKGGVNSGIARREKRDRRKQAEAIADALYKDEHGMVCKNPYNGEDMTLLDAILVRLFGNALKGDNRAIVEVLRTLGMAEEPQVNQQINIGVPKTPEERYNEVYGRIEDAYLLEPDDNQSEDNP